MKIAVTSTGPSLEDAVEARFGRCAYFLIIDPKTMEYESVQNPNIAAGGGAGIQSAQLMADKGVSTVLTGNCGPNAFRTFGAAGVKVITGVSGQVKEAVQSYNAGKLNESAAPNVQSHFGMGMGGGRGMGQGMGMGRGMGPGQDAAQTPPMSQTAPSLPKAADKEGEIKALKEQAESLRKQMETIIARIEEIENKNNE
ncbi:MAG: DUF5320 family protein [Candidatus Aminicenantes bacterium]|nr:DUF5320 family protein [Candidatus Aminicenantes bacterium]